MTSQNATERLTVVCLLRPRPEQADRLRDALLALVTPTRAEASCLAYDLYDDAEGSFVLFENWRSEAELKRHQQQPAVRALFGDRLKELLAEEMGVHYGAALEPAAEHTT